ncbi:FAD dependent oxidoreductase [Hymenopellis radicata]|nr:FAD dependent oxidoreductase [Hymenopellis radicata]
MTHELPPPGLPVERPCLSIWQRTTRQNPLINEGASSPIPETAEAVVIGSGLAGTVTAYELLTSPNGPKKIVMLEAREACSGASGRNAGHCRPDAFRGFTAFSKIHGPEQAMKIIQHEKLVLQLVKKFIDTHNIDCDFDYCKTFDVILGEDFFTYVTESFESYKKAGGDTTGISWYEQEEARKVTRVPSALGAFEWMAANLHPAKLCLAILAMNRRLGLSLFTHTPATSVTAGDNNTWIVHTPRGSITTPLVVHATNAFAAALLPQLHTLLTPMRAQAHKVIPTPAFSSTNMITHTYSLRFALHHFYSLIQRKSDGAMVLGTSRGIPGMSEITRSEITSKNDDFGEEALGEGHEFGWTGILGMTRDSVPFIGPVPGLAGQYVMAGFNGHGMARIFGCAPGLAKMMTGGAWADTGMPECFQITADRIDKLKA